MAGAASLFLPGRRRLSPSSFSFSCSPELRSTATTAATESTAVGKSTARSGGVGHSAELDGFVASGFVGGVRHRESIWRRSRGCFGRGRRQRLGACPAAAAEVVACPAAAEAVAWREKRRR
jgi:hypothetical protein